MPNEPTIEDLGYDASFESERSRLGLCGFPVARVTSVQKGACRVRDASGERLARVTGKRMFTATSRTDYPAVGDWVAIEALDAERAVIHGTLPRRTVLKRTCGDRNRAGGKDEVQVIAANIDVAFIVESVDRDYSLNRFERYRTLAESGGVVPALVLNKTDLLSADELAARTAELRERFPGVAVIPASTVTMAGLDDLRAHIRPRTTYCLLGSSGVGKSSLINALIGGHVIRTETIGSRSGRGRHTTTSRQLYLLAGGGIVIDNPGMREVGIADAPTFAGAAFGEVTALAERCRYADCTHTHEPGCAVAAAVAAGTLDAAKHLNYVSLAREAKYHEMSASERREKDRWFGKFLKTAKEELTRAGRKEPAE
jgi:ribosome biogenesis GTPase / thiamine phosphate phosphatase